MAYKDEYEVGAPVHRRRRSREQLAEQFEGDDLQLEFYMAPPVAGRSRRRRPSAPRKIRLGGWMLPVLKLLAHGQGAARHGVRSRSAAPRSAAWSARLIVEYEARVDELLRRADAERLAVAAAIADVPVSIRGYGHVKLANLAMARARESRAAAPLRSASAIRARAVAPVAGQFRGIPVTSRAPVVLSGWAAALLHFCDGHVVFHARRRVARPGSLALAPLAASARR